MTHGCDVVVRRTANGFVVEPKSGAVSSEQVAAGWMVFSTLEQLTGYLATHFSRPEQTRGAAVGEARAIPGTYRNWRCD